MFIGIRRVAAVAQVKRPRTAVSVNLATGKAWVETRPIRDNIVSSRGSMGRWVGPENEVLKLSRRRQSVGFGIGAAVSAYVFCLGLWHKINNGASADQAPAMMAIGAIFGLGMLFFLARMSTYTFDRNSGKFSKSRLYGPKRRPLTDIIAMQLITNYHVSPKFSTSKSYSTYQLNMVLDDNESPRENLSTTGDLEWVRGGGQTLAKFLGVPLLDQVELTVNNFL
jgi:hypothetical protein